MQSLTTQPTTALTTTNNQTTTTPSTTTIYPNDVTWESVGQYIHLFNQCWLYTPALYLGRSSYPEKCDFKSYKTVADFSGIDYPCLSLKEEFSVYIAKVDKLSDYICPRSDLAKVFDARGNDYERYDDANYINQLLTAGTSVSIAAVGASFILASFSAFNKLDTQDTEGVSCAAKYWFPITLLASSIVPIITGSITAAAWANDGLPSDSKDCIEYHLLQDMGQLAHNVTGIDYL
jgi:hypothetical protein